MKIEFDYKEIKMILVYDVDGSFEHVINLDNNEKMMVEYTQVGSGYEYTENNGYVKMTMCNAVYIRIIELDVFIPKFMFIPNK